MIFSCRTEDPNLKSKDLSAKAESSENKQFKKSEISEIFSKGSLVDYESLHRHPVAVVFHDSSGRRVVRATARLKACTVKDLESL